MSPTSKIPRGQTPERQAYMKEYCATHPKRDRRAYKAAYDAAHRAEIGIAERRLDCGECHGVVVQQVVGEITTKWRHI